MPPALPGFYYDADKEKYFKIQPNHAAARGSARKYSKAAVEKEAEEQREQKRRKILELRERKMRVTRSRVLGSPLAGGCGLTRELGLAEVESIGATVMGAWAQCLRGKEVSRFRHRGGGSGMFVFDCAAGVLTHAEAFRGDRADASFFVFVDFELLRLPGGCDADADGVFFRRHIVPGTGDLERGSWVELGAVSGCHVFDSQVIAEERKS